MAATATMTPTTSTNTYSSIVVTSFPSNPLTTQFVAPTSCGEIYNGNIYMLDPQENCLPSSHRKEETAYFSPGYVCPKGYMTAKIDNKGVRSITTVTCCPYRSDIILSAVDPATLSGQWIGLFCTWIAPEATRIDIVHTADTRTWTQQEYVTSPGGVNAYGVRMVYQSSDLSSSATSSMASVSATSTGNVTVVGPTSERGLSSGASIAIAAVVPVVVLGLVAGGLFWWWRKRQALKYNRVNDANMAQNQGPPGMPPAQRMHQPGPVHEASTTQQYQDPHVYQQQHHHPPVQTMQSMQSLPSTYPSSTTASSVQQSSPSVPYSQQYGHNGVYTSYAGYKPPSVLEESPTAPSGQTFTSELPAAVPRELPEDRPGMTASGVHIDHQKAMGMGPLR
ncbi:transmembrane alpha-helix domain-containing protein [Colletotrichum truncatum]|uniref:Transmembrane alpha-helix domain-containing protein n=1 Tax=Colletotrichum truncatum TaxID=5467 RepID=A0ACC3YZP3_COLTU|nr:transmembrane alpha-helix domain-containing protein [Colletotrichum truncatum]KAF6786308.1 transmembrane alpha-helix domain-containing protein [Colletotrichum truncatum]